MVYFRHDTYLIYSFPEHLPHKLKQLQMVLMDVRGGRRIQPLVSTCGLQQTIITTYSGKKENTLKFRYLSLHV